MIGGRAAARRVRAVLILAVVAVMLAGVETRAAAQGLRFSAPLDLTVTLTGAGAWVTSQGLRADLVPSHCRWCDRDNVGNDELNRVDRSVRRLRWTRRDLADSLSNMTAFVGTPLVAAGSSALAASHDERSHDVGPDLLLVAESGVLAADLNQLVKFIAVRERPYAHARALADPAARATSVDDDLSFYSGHATEAVSLAVAAGTVASLRGYRLAPLVWASSLPLALVTGYLRIGADRHYFTDVLVGAVAGAAVGCLVPYVLHRPDATTVSPSPAGPAPVIAFSGAW
jgi:membrane-associated phospholipid phosphatase